MIKPIINIKNNDNKNFTIVSAESVIMNYDNCDAELNYTADHIDEETSERYKILEILNSNKYKDIYNINYLLMLLEKKNF